jgi:predicted nucleotidyltransferase
MDLSESGASSAVIGGLAVSARTEPRFTKDVDLAVAVTQDSDAEALVQYLTSKQYRISALVEQEAVNRLATVRLIPAGEPSLVVDLLFASSGIESEIVAASEFIEIVDGVMARVATIPYLIATKILSRDDGQRPQDHMDLIALRKAASENDLAIARSALAIIQERGFSRGKDLLMELQRFLSA